MKGCRTRSVQAGIPTQSVGMPARTLRVRQVSILLPTISAVILVAGRGASRQAFPRRAWERERSRSHALRGNACSDAPRPASVNPPPDYPCCHSRCRTRSVQAGIPTLRVGTRTFSFPRSAWECLLGRSASGKCQSSSRLSLLSFSLQDAERPCRHSHAPRGNDKNKFWTPESKIYLGRLVQNKLVYNDERRAWER
jgi:hypothetical protein